MQITKPKISIIVPVYKAEPYLKKCIDSILNQTFKDFELILINDGSTDNSGKICDEYALKDKRIKVIHKENGGLSSARNVGLDIAQGKYLGFVDSDDWIDSDMYEILYKLIKESGKEIANIGVKFIYDNNQNKCLSNHKILLFSREEAIEELLKQKLFKDYFCCNLFKKSLFNDLKFEEGKKFEDLDLMYKIILKSNGIVTSGETKYNYFQNNLGITYKYNLAEEIDLQLAYYKRENYLKDKHPEIYIKLYNFIYNKRIFYINYDGLFLHLVKGASKTNIDLLVKIINKHFKENMSLKIPIKLKLRLILLKISIKLYYLSLFYVKKNKRKEMNNAI